MSSGWHLKPRQERSAKWENGGGVGVERRSNGKKNQPGKATGGVAQASRGRGRFLPALSFKAQVCLHCAQLLNRQDLVRGQNGKICETQQPKCKAHHVDRI